MTARFYTPDALAPGEFLLTGDEAHHLAAVRRCAPGDRVVLFNGDGREYPADILSLGRKQVLLTVVGVESPDRELPFNLEVAAAMPKGDRGDFLIEKLVELGVARFTPLETARTVVVPKAARLENLRQAVIEASKQCGRNLLMQISDVMKWNAFLLRGDLPTTRVMLTTEATRPLIGIDDSVMVAIGPEGGWEASEREAGMSAGWVEASLGPRVLRVETAAI